MNLEEGHLRGFLAWSMMIRVSVTPSTDSDYTLCRVSCVDVTPAMMELLEALQDWPAVDLDGLRERPEWDQARAWGWIMESGELTGTGLAHVHELPGGIVID